MNDSTFDPDTLKDDLKVCLDWRFGRCEFIVKIETIRLKLQEEDKKRELQAQKELEKKERAQLKRLKAKYES